MPWGWSAGTWSRLTRHVCNRRVQKPRRPLSIRPPYCSAPLAASECSGPPVERQGEPSPQWGHPDCRLSVELRRPHRWLTAPPTPQWGSLGTQSSWWSPGVIAESICSAIPKLEDHQHLQAVEHGMLQSWGHTCIVEQPNSLVPRPNWSPFSHTPWGDVASRPPCAPPLAWCSHNSPPWSSGSRRCWGLGRSYLPQNFCQPSTPVLRLPKLSFSCQSFQIWGDVASPA